MGKQSVVGSSFQDSKYRYMSKVYRYIIVKEYRENNALLLYDMANRNNNVSASIYLLYSCGVMK